MKKILSLLMFLCILILAAFFLLNDLELLFQDSLNETRTQWGYAVLSFFILVSDIVLPIPSSIVMMLNGKMLGVFPGAMLSLTAGLMSSAIGYVIGYSSRNAVNRFYNKEDIQRAEQVFARVGYPLIIFSRALPVLSESVSILSGSVPLSFRRYMICATIGQAITSFSYAALGTLNLEMTGNVSSALVMVGMALAAVAVYLFRRKQKQPAM